MPSSTLPKVRPLAGSGVSRRAMHYGPRKHPVSRCQEYTPHVAGPGGPNSNGVRAMLRRLAVTACAAILALANASTAQAITNGKPDFTHTYTGAIVAVGDSFGPDPIAYCSGTLVAPTVFVTAAHCLVDQPADVTFLGITFDQDLTDGITRITPIASLVPHPDYPGVENHDIFTDIGVVRLSQPVTDVGFATLPTLNQFAGLKPGPRSWFTKVGYGIQVYKGSQLVDISARYMATSQLIKTYDSGNSSVWSVSGAKGTGGGTCFGDSGGSVLWQDTNILAAVHSSGFKQCVMHGFEVRLDTPLAQAFLRQFVSL